MKVLIVSADRTVESGHAQNIGDAFLTHALAERLRSAGHVPLAVDFGATPRIGSARGRVNVRGITGLVSLIRGADAVVVGGGTLLADDQPARPFAGLPRLVLVTGLIARLFRTPLAAFGVGCDPVPRRRARAAFRVALGASRIWVRDTDSAERAAAFSSYPVAVAADVCLFARDELATLADRSTPARGAVLALNRRHGPDVSVDDIDRLERAHGAVVRFVSMDQGVDPDAAALPPEVRDRVCLEPGGHDWRRAAEILASSEVVVASRMHAMYLGAMVSTRVVAIAGAAKVDGFIEEFGVESVGSLADLREQQGGTPGDPRAALAEAHTRLENAFEEMIAWLRRSA